MFLFWESYDNVACDSGFEIAAGISTRLDKAGLFEYLSFIARVCRSMADKEGEEEEKEKVKEGGEKEIGKRERGRG